MKNLGSEHENLDQKAYLIVKAMINDRRLAPGEKICQERLAGELGISRTPLISALKYLEKEKLVEARARRGFFVRVFYQHEMISIFELREVLEGLAARRAAMAVTDRQINRLRGFFSSFAGTSPITNYRDYCREDRRFHNFVTQIASQEFLESILSTYNIISFSYQLVSSEGLVRPPDETRDEHLAIIDAICHRDPEASESRMRLHFKRTIAHLTDMAGINHEATRPFDASEDMGSQQEERRKHLVRQKSEFHPV
ncbi:GntR family transcriptional regulator [Desulfosarcina sp.]|uniref:GntR family transcriptional regulator n=1 Tax=Desulfosarcina sp. TaxID=2027861 RepID=UPI0039707B80